MKTNPPDPRKADAAGPQVACPACGNLSTYSVSNAFRPFCSERCKVIDLGAWASDQYKIAGNPKELSSDDPEAEQGNRF